MFTIYNIADVFSEISPKKITFFLGKEYSSDVETLDLIKKSKNLCAFLGSSFELRDVSFWSQISNFCEEMPHFFSKKEFNLFISPTSDIFEIRNGLQNSYLLGSKPYLLLKGNQQDVNFLSSVASSLNPFLYREDLFVAFGQRCAVERKPLYSKFAYEVVPLAA